MESPDLDQNGAVCVFSFQVSLHSKKFFPSNSELGNGLECITKLVVHSILELCNVA